MFFRGSAGPIMLRGCLSTVCRKSFATTVHKKQEAEEGKKKMASIFCHRLIYKLEEQAQAPFKKKKKKCTLIKIILWICLPNIGEIHKWYLVILEFRISRAISFVCGALPSPPLHTYSSSLSKFPSLLLSISRDLFVTQLLKQAKTI